MSGISYFPLTRSQTQVFVGEKGNPWKFFVEATAVRGRPTLIRKIIKNGGSVVNSAREADILLAENNTKEALELFEAWRGDKILLSTRWVARCLEAHAFLGSDRGWGGYEFTREVLLQGIIVSDDASEGEEEEVSHSPKSSRCMVPSSQASKTSPGKSWSEPGPSRLRTPSTAFPKLSRTLSSNAEQVIEQNPPNFSANTHHSTPLSSGNLLHAPQTSTLPMDTSLQASHSSTQTILQQQQQALFATMFSNLIQSSQQPLNQDIFTSLGQYSSFPQISPLLAPPLQQFFTQQLAANPLASQSRPPELAEQPGLGSTGQQLLGFGVPSGSTQESSTRPTPEDVDTDLVSDAASVRSEEGEVELSISRRRGGKRREISDSSSDREVQMAVRSNPLRSKENSPRKLTGIFVDEQGMPRQFYVMVDIKNRKDLLKIIRKHNGAIVSQMKDAEFIILSNRSNQFQKALDLLPNHKIAISPTWLEECENMGKMVEMAPHVIDVTSGVGRGASRLGRKPVATKASLSVLEECKSGEEASGHIGQPETPYKVLPTANTQEGKITAPRARSQSPLPPTNITPTSQGNLFTDEDRIWFFKYARFKLERDHYLSHSALMRAIAHKAPHHTVKSWSNTARTRWSDEMETLKQEIVALCGQTREGLLLPSSPSTPHDTQNELMYPETSPLPVPSQSSINLPAGSASTSCSSQAESTCMTPLKRKERPSEDQVGVVAMDQHNKKPKITQDNVIDVDAYLEGWVMPVR